MTFERNIAAAFHMTDAVWARHANPWSVWTRMTVGPMLAVAIWSRAWIGWWSLLPVAASLVWMWVNPRLFPPPRSATSWATRAVLGERIWVDRDRRAIPTRHRAAPHVLSAVSAAGLVPLGWGLAVFNPWAAGLGMAILCLAKLWFADRMVWLYEDVARGRSDLRDDAAPFRTPR
ncbi:MAG: DUF6653 family protein [Phycisphaeraceae bacterium]